MQRARRLGAALALTAALGAAAARADAPPAPPSLVADTERTGLIDLYVFDQPRSAITFYERLRGGRRVRLGSVVDGGYGGAYLRGAATWRCDRLTRRFQAVVRHPDGTVARPRFEVRTPPCSDRFDLVAPRTVAPGARVTATVVDTWGLGDVAPTICVIPPRGHHRCQRVSFGGASSFERRLRPGRDGRWVLQASLGKVRTRRAIYVGVPPRGARRGPRPVVLISGDSTVEGMDAHLAQRIGHTVRLRRGWRGGSSLSSPQWDWPGMAARQVAELAPRVTIISLGANEGWPMDAPDGTRLTCCGAGWSAEYARRLRGLMATYEQGGRGHVLWMLLPRPRDPRLARIATAVNRAVRGAAAGDPGITLVRLDRILTPGWRFRRTMRYRGRVRVVRAPDGLHLSPAGGAIAADVLVRVLGRMPQLLARGR